MNDELNRFFKSIGFTSSLFSEASILKVVLKKQEESFEVYINNPYVIEITEINKLFLCAKNGINGEKKCTINMTYEKVNDEDILEYVYYLLDDIILKRPSLIGLKNSNIEVVDNTIYFNVISEFEQHDLLNETKGFFLFILFKHLEEKM